MKSELILSGIGGQGIMSIGELLCGAAVKKDYVVTFTPFYGQEKRGGRTMCQIVVSDYMGSPIISAADLMMVMDERSLKDYEDKLKPGAPLILNSDLVKCGTTRKDIKVIEVPFNELAKQAGNAKAANMVGLGVVLKYIDFVTPADVEAELPELFPGAKAKLIPVNRKALELGYNF